MLQKVSGGVVPAVVPSALAVPLWIWLDPTRRCNLACEFCYTKHSHARDDMSPETLNRILDQLEPVKKSIRVVHLNWRGEPLMNARFEELLQLYFERWPEVPMHWHTNGILLTPRRAERLVGASRPHTLFVSIDGGTEAAHERNRGVGSFRPALKGLRNLIAANGRNGPLRVGVYQIDFGVPASEFDPEFVELAQRAHEWVRFAPLELDGAEAAANEPFDRACFWAGHAMCIDPLGRVSVCLLAKGEYGVLGDLLQDRVENIIDRAQVWRSVLSTHGRSSKSQCSACRKKNGGPL
jgi:sulfatase maturation enzyme AslB (radical SAM superfamily)